MRTRSFRPLVWLCLLALLPAIPSFAADEEVFSLGEVIVTSEQQVVNLATTVTEVSAEDIKQRGAQTVADALKMLPGVVVQKGGKQQATVSVRGFNQGDLKVLMDGVPVYEQYFKTFDLDQIPADSIAKITVVKGASSVLYGANTQGGVINIITKKAGAKPSATATAAWGDYGTERYGVSFGAPAGPFNYWVGYTYRHSNGWRLSSDYDEDHWAAEYSDYTKDDGGARDDSGYLQHSFLAKVGYEPSDDTKLYLTFNYLNNDKGIPSNGWYITDYDRWQVSLVGEQRINDWLRIKARGYYVDHEDTLLQKDYIYGAPGWDSRGWFLESAYDNYTVGGEVQGLMDFGRWSFVKLGFSYVRDDLSQQETGRNTSPDPALVPPVWVDAGDFEADTYSIALEDEVKVTDWLSFVAGVSYDHFSPEITKPDVDSPDGEIAADNMDAFNPQAGVVVSLSEQTILHGSVGKKTRFPHVKELYSKNGGGNTSLKEQKTIAYEIGLTHDFSEWFRGLFLQRYRRSHQQR